MTGNSPSNQQGDSTERYYADMEHARAFHEEEYFKARPQLLRSPAEQALFRAGFERAFKFLWQRFIDAEADMLRLHNQLMDAKYPDRARGADETSPVQACEEGTVGYPPCFFCGCSIEEHRAGKRQASHEWREGDRVTGRDQAKAHAYFSNK